MDQFPKSVSNSYFDAKAAFDALGRSATVRPDLLNSKRVVSEIAQIRQFLDALEANAVETHKAMRRQKAAERLANTKAKKKMGAYLERNPEARARAIELGLVAPPVEVQPEVIEVQTAPPQKRMSLLSFGRPR